jgi:hypothetical protein
MDGLKNIVRHGAILSHDIQKELGIAPKSSGSRPDVVQFTRDHYDAQGQLRQPGLVGSNTLGVAGDAALVFDESIMDDPEYGSIDTYPNVPSVSLDKLRAVALENEADMPRITELLEQNGIQAEVTTREEWAERLQQDQPR